MGEIEQRKKDHVDLTVSGNVGYDQGTGFERYELIHNALPEINMDEVSTEATFLGRTFSFPLFFSSMTGGYTKAGAVNAILAEFCETYNLPLGVGSQRIMLEHSESVESFAIVRKKAPSAFIASNIGGAQLIGGLPQDQVLKLIDTIEADAIIVHLNPLQELMQPEGDRNFGGIEDGIKKLVSQVSLPVIVKETGAGISTSVAKRLLQVGVAVIDTAGAGGTSWAKVENRRPNNTNPKRMFDNWGISTVDSLQQVLKQKDDFDFSVIASGGIRSSIDIAKALCLGADFTATARPVIQAIVNEGQAGLETMVSQWKRHMKIILTLLGCKQIKELNTNHIK